MTAHRHHSTCLGRVLCTLGLSVVLLLALLPSHALAWPHRPALTVTAALPVPRQVVARKGSAATTNRAHPGAGWGWPVTVPEVLRAFEPPAHDWLAGHRGVDLRATPGTPVKAAAAGRVAFVGRVVDRDVIVVDHGGVRTTYEPVAAEVAAGTALQRGQPIGTIANGGHCNQRCLHWGAIREGDYVDPILLVSGYRPVLKTPH